MLPFIVAEVSKNWRADEYVEGLPPSHFLCAQFERIIEFNRGRGYRLHSFQLHRMLTGPDVMNETIIAVFELQPKKALQAE